MGFLGSFNPVKIISNVIKNPVAAIPKAVVSGGTSLVSPQISKALTPLTTTLYNPNLIAPAVSTTARSPMGFNLGGVLAPLGNVLAGTSAIPQLQGVGQFLTALAPAFAQPVSNQQPVQMQATQRVAGAGTMTREVFEAASKLLAKVGIAPTTVAGFMSAVSRVMSALAALARRTPVGTLVSVLVGVGLAVNEANTLVAWWSTKRKRRRMNPGNAKALRRAVRRLRSFDRMSARVYARLHIGRGASRGRARKAYCRTCRRDPCAC